MYNVSAGDKRPGHSHCTKETLQKCWLYGPSVLAASLVLVQYGHCLLTMNAIVIFVLHLETTYAAVVLENFAA